MHIITKDVPLQLANTSNSNHLLNKDFLIFDIETTGFSQEYAIIYMIGCIYKTDKGYEYCNIFAQNPYEEYKIIKYFFKMLKDFNCIIHFNGNRFDIPFLLARAHKHGITDQISHIHSIDIYELLRPFRKNLDFPNLKLDTIQSELGYKRQDTYTGGNLIQVYHNYVDQPYEPYYELLLLHNREDVEGMINLLPIIDVFRLINDIIMKQNFEFLNVTQDEDKVRVLYKLPYKMPIDFKLAHRDSRFILSSSSDNVELTLPLQSETKRFFFKNYQDYMYIPETDEVIHKSIASFIPTHKKKKANKSNCYVSHTGFFIPIFGHSGILRMFQDSVKSKDSYVLFSSELDADFFKEQMVGFLKECKGL